MSSRVLLKSHRTELVEKNSRFIGIGCISQSLNEFKQQKETLEREFADANHVTFAYRIFSDDTLHIRFNDAGEPSGTAGKPILMHLEGKHILNCTLFVVRYFGGVKLGAGGLVKAYGNTARQLIEEAEWGPYIVFHEAKIAFPYSEQTRFEYLAKKHGVTILDRSFGTEVILSLRLPKDDWPLFQAEWPLSWFEQKD